MLNDAHLFEMMSLAKDIGLDELKTTCENHIISTLSVSNACNIMMAAMELHEKGSG